MYELSRQALRDLDGILEYTLLQHGLDQAERYVDSLKRAFATLARTSQFVFQPELHRLRGTALELEGDLESAQES